ncbi:MAG: HEPN domain-containing protein [Deltaproteobacteria bacterium]|nr:HEPN domain-containing protein [Deltaproteobacteria bacterium]
MAAKKISTTTLPKSEFKNYWGKALQFYNAMNLCLQDQEWDAVLLNGVHAAISASDALTVFLTGKRSSSKLHQDAVALLIHAVSENQEDRKNASRLSEILNEKHQIEYEPRRFTEREAFAFAQKTERFFEWVKNRLP